MNPEQPLPPIAVVGLGLSHRRGVRDHLVVQLVDAALGLFVRRRPQVVVTDNLEQVDVVTLGDVLE